MRRATQPARRPVDPELEAEALEIRAWLTRTPRQLPARLFYDPLGSALFEAICHLPWYGITRAERALLATHGAAMLGAMTPLGRIVELGPGSGEKLADLLGSRAPDAAPLEVHLVDVSVAALESAVRTVGATRSGRVVAHAAEYGAGLAAAMASRVGGRTLVLFLGSNIGNFDPPEAAGLLRAIRARLRPGDGCLIGTDLVKPEAALRSAYDDPIGVTAAFNLNVLVRLNREFGADFVVEHFRHRALWNEAQARVEMHLVSTRPQRVRLPGADLVIDLDAGESIWTESSHKYTPDGVARLLAPVGLAVRQQWIDPVAGFALTLAVVPPPFGGPVEPDRLSGSGALPPGTPPRPRGDRADRRRRRG